MTEEKRNQKQRTEVKTFPVPYFLSAIKENITINRKAPYTPSKEEIINQAFKFHSEGNISEAVKYYQYFINQGFSNHRVFSNYGVILQGLGKLKEAEIYTRKAIEVKSKSADAYLNLGNILKALGNSQEAETSTRQAIKLKPDLAIAHSNLATILRETGREDEANESYLSASRKAPNDIYFYLNSNLRLSRIMHDEEQINRERDRYRQKIKEIRTSNNFKIGELNGFNPSMFYLAYQNRLDDRLILEELSGSISKARGMVCTDFSKAKYLISSMKRNSLKIGICSTFLNENHTVGRLYINVLCDLLKTDLDITIYIPPGTKKDSGIDKIKSSFKRIIDLPNSPHIGTKIIASDELDIIFYPDIGMCSYTYILALSRLALVQVNSIGHANTSGIKNMDYLITYEIEPSTSDSNYTERLVRFSRLPFNYSVPKINESKTYKSIIDSKNNFIIGLTQSLFKLHPDYDKVIESILIEIKNAFIIIVKDKTVSSTKALKKRWQSRNNLLMERTIFLDRMSKDNFLNTIRKCHIMLDPFYFGSGNTFYESMAFGIPFITYPHNQKTKIASAGYKQMQIKNPPIASSPEDYIAWCKLYSNNRSLLEETKNELIQKANKYLFNDEEIYKEYYNFFCESVKKAKKGDFLESNWNPSIL